MSALLLSKKTSRAARTPDKNGFLLDCPRALFSVAELGSYLLLSLVAVSFSVQCVPSQHLVIPSSYPWHSCNLPYVLCTRISQNDVKRRVCSLAART